MKPCPRIRVIGMGNEWRGDDGAGLMVARHLNTRYPDELPALEFSGDAAGLFAAWQGADMAIIADATHGHGSPGEIYRLAAPWEKHSLLLTRLTSSHAFGLTQALALGEVLGELPPVLIIYGIVGRNFQPGRGLTRRVAAAVPEVSRRIRTEIQQCSDHDQISVPRRFAQ